MRLTTVAQMSLPGGRLRSLRVSALPGEGRELPVSFDQGRHVDAGDRAGSWMAIAFRLPVGTDDDVLEAAWLDVVQRHGTLRTVFSRDDEGALRLHEREVASEGWREHDRPESAASRDALRRLLDRECRPFAAPSHLLCVAETHDAEQDRRPMCVIASDHAHVDMWSLAVVAGDLLARLAPDARPDADESVPSFATHTALLASMPPAPDEVRDGWRSLLEAGDGRMPVFPLPLGRLDAPREAVVEIRDVLDSQELEAFEQSARRQGVRAIALSMAAMASATRRLADRPLRAVFPVHSRFEERWRHSVGWFITNSLLDCGDPDPLACSADVARAIELGGHPLAPILEPWGGMVEPPGMFAISWLDVRRLPVALPAEAEAQYVSAVISTDTVMIWFIVNDTGMHIRCRYPDTAEARDSLTQWLDALESDLREHACAS